jgi:hypothetical protein
MAVKPGEEIGEDVHEDRDQFLASRRRARGTSSSTASERQWKKMSP